MGSGFRGDFGLTKGSKSYSIAASIKDSKLVFSQIICAPTNIQKMAKRSPMNIPSTALYKVQSKDGYKQVKFNYEKGNTKYEIRWHEKTKDSPKYMQESWQVEKTVKGKGYGTNPIPKQKFNLIKGQNWKKIWIPHNEYQKCIVAKKNGTLTQKQKEVLDNAHWRDE